MKLNYLDESISIHYDSYNGNHVELSIGNGIHTTNTIFLDPYTLNKVLDYLHYLKNRILEQKS